MNDSTGLTNLNVNPGFYDWQSSYSPAFLKDGLVLDRIWIQALIAIFDVFEKHQLKVLHCHTPVLIGFN